ncbi:MAG TPA: hypothetical protein VFU55_11285 [Terracidiphilus sp.]|nr:hypothetical protein [Terracidiphilus sp.]
MGRKGAFVMVAVMVLWAVTPALACLAPAAHRSCCGGMVMNECHSPAMVQCDDCCNAQPADSPLLPDAAVTIDHLVAPAPSSVSIARMLPEVAANAILPAAEAPLPSGSPGSGSVLRI